MTGSQGDARPEIAAERQHVVDLAFRMFGSTPEAETLAQQTYARWDRLSTDERERVAEPHRRMADQAAGDCLDMLGSEQDQRFPGTSRTEHSAVVGAFRRAGEAGNSMRLRALLSPSVTALTDGGGKVPAETHPIHGVDNVVRLVQRTLARPGLAVSEEPVNGPTGLVVRQSDTVVAILCLNVRAARVTDVWVILNPDKLRRWNRTRHPASP